MARRKRNQVEIFKVTQMTIRVRTDEDKRVIDRLKLWTRQGSASRALMAAARRLEPVERERDELRDELATLRRRIDSLKHRRGELDGARERFEEAVRCL